MTTRLDRILYVGSYMLPIAVLFIACLLGGCATGDPYIDSNPSHIRNKF